MIIAISGKIGSGKDTIGKIIQLLTLSKEKGVNESNVIEILKRFPTDESFNNFIAGHNNWKIRKFAYKLKQIVSILTGCKVEDLESQEFKNKELGEEWNWYKTLQSSSDGAIFMRSTPTEEAKKMLPFPERIKPYTYREMLQRVGTEAMRNQIHEDVWVNALFADYKSLYVAGIDPYDVEDIKSKDVYISNPIYPNWIITDLRFPNELKAVENRDGITIRVNRELYYYGDDKVTYKELQRLTYQDTGHYPDLNYAETNWKVKDNHPSETALDDANFKYTIDNNGTIEQLIEKIREILIKENII